MPELSIQAKPIKRVLSAEVQITHDDAREAKQNPTCQFVIRLPLDHDAMIAEWALAPQGTGRWKTVELKTLDRSKTVKHTWTLLKAYVHHYEEFEFPNTSGSTTDQGNYVELVIRGTLLHNNEDYSGKNILSVTKGATEPGSA